MGLFGLALADRVRRVIGVEADSSAADDFRYNGQGLDHVALSAGEVERVLPGIDPPVDLLVLDPPVPGPEQL